MTFQRLKGPRFMLTQEDDVDIHALRKRGWSISAIARHRKTVRDYLNGKRVAGQRKPVGPDPFAPFVEYATARLKEVPHPWAVALFDEVGKMGNAFGMIDILPAEAPSLHTSDVTYPCSSPGSHPDWDGTGLVGSLSGGQ